MASDEQIAANRRNARRSTGPRSGPGKRRASRNSLRHGLTARRTLNGKAAEQIEQLARKVAGDSTNVMGLENARAFAQAEFDLAQVRVAKVAVIQKMALTRAEEPMRFATRDQAWQFVRGFARGKLIGPMPLKEPERTDEALRRVLSVLIKLERYEHCAAVRRARALHKFLEAKKSKTT